MPTMKHSARTDKWICSTNSMRLDMPMPHYSVYHVFALSKILSFSVSNVWRGFDCQMIWNGGWPTKKTFQFLLEVAYVHRGKNPGLYCTSRTSGIGPWKFLWLTAKKLEDSSRLSPHLPTLGPKKNLKFKTQIQHTRTLLKQFNSK